MDKRKKVGIFLTLLGGTCWGISGCFGQYLFQEKAMTAEWLVAVRLLWAGILLTAMGFVIKKRQMLAVFKNKKDTIHLIVFSFFGMLLCQYSYFAAIQNSNAGTATVLQSLNPLMILGVVCVKEMRLPKRFEAGAIFTALTGTFLLSTHGNISSMTITSLALIFGLTSAVTAAMYNLLSGDLMHKYGVYTVVGYGMLFAGFMMAPVVRPWTYSIQWDLGAVLGVVGVVVIGTAVAFSLYLKGVSIVGPFMGSLLGSIEPVTAIGVSLLFLGSEFHILDLVGFVLILVTVFSLSYHSGKEARKAEGLEETKS